MIFAWCVIAINLQAVKKAAVYRILFVCGARYIEQTSRCLHYRLPEHKRNVKDKAMQSEVVRHLNACSRVVVSNVGHPGSLKKKEQQAIT